MRPHRQGTEIEPSDITDAEWAAISSVFPKPRGMPRHDDRSILNGIMWRLRTGRAWASIPHHYGPYMRCHGRFQRWRDTGIWRRIVEAACQVHGANAFFIDASAVAVPPCWHSVAGEADPVAWVTRDALSLRALFSILGRNRACPTDMGLDEILHGGGAEDAPNAAMVQEFAPTR